MPIEIKNLTHVYMQGSPFERAALRDVSLTIQDGEFVGLIGHTGSGKSTLVQHFNGLLKPSSGRVVIDGLALDDKNTSLLEVRRRVGLVFQYPEYQLFDETVLKDVCFGPKNLGLSDAEAEERARAALRMVGMADESVYDKSPFELSGGQKRRVAVAGVLAMRPKILILDEPAAGLDPQGREEVLSLMVRIHREDHNTMIMVSHSMSDVARLCGRILVMNRGSLAMDGAPDAIFAREAELREMGLGLPPYAQLASALRAAGFSVPEGAFEIDALEQAILSSVRPKG